MVVRGFAQVKSAFGDEDDLDRQASLIANLGVPPKEIRRNICDGRLEEQVNLLNAIDDLGGGDTFVFARLDSLSSNCDWGLRMIREMHRKGINLVVVEQGIDDSTLGLERLRAILEVAEWEYSDKGDLIKAAMAAARDRGAVIGRPKKLNEQMRRYIFEMLQAGNTKSALERAFGVSRRSIIRIEREFSNG